MRWNVHICSLHKAGHSRGAPVASPRTQAPASEARASYKTVRMPRRDTV